MLLIWVLVPFSHYIQYLYNNISVLNQTINFSAVRLGEHAQRDFRAVSAAASGGVVVMFVVVAAQGRQTAVCLHAEWAFWHRLGSGGSEQRKR